jgi:hypothetical protein
VGQSPASVRAQEIRDDGLLADERNLGHELANEKAQKDAKDVVLIEATRILGDEVRLLQSKVKRAAGVKPAYHLMPE